SPLVSAALRSSIRENFSRSIGPRFPFTSWVDETVLSAAGLSVFALFFSCASAGMASKEVAITVINAVFDFMVLDSITLFTDAPLVGVRVMCVFLDEPDMNMRINYL